MSIKKALYWSAFWIFLSAVVAGIVYFFSAEIYKLSFFSKYFPTSGEELKEFEVKKSLEFITGYVLEKALSIDNLFVFLLLFTYFKIPADDQRRLLNYGIWGAVILRGIFISLGTLIVENFHWVLYIFGVLLFYAAYHIVFGKEKEIEPDKNIIIRLIKKIIPIDTTQTNGKMKFLIFKNKKVYATPFLIVLILVETTDVIFAIDSIPAIFSITTDPFIVFASNILAILGLRSLYFLLERLQSIFIYVKYGIGVLLAFAGIKMFIHIPIGMSLGFIVVVLTFVVLLSLLYKKEEV